MCISRGTNFLFITFFGRLSPYFYMTKVAGKHFTKCPSQHPGVVLLN